MISCAYIEWDELRERAEDLLRAKSYQAALVLILENIECQGFIYHEAAEHSLPWLETIVEQSDAEVVEPIPRLLLNSLFPDREFRMLRSLSFAHWPQHHEFMARFQALLVKLLSRVESPSAIAYLNTLIFLGQGEIANGSENRFVARSLQFCFALRGDSEDPLFISALSGCDASETLALLSEDSTPPAFLEDSIKLSLTLLALAKPDPNFSWLKSFLRKANLSSDELTYLLGYFRGRFDEASRELKSKLVELVESTSDIFDSGLKEHFQIFFDALKR